MVVVDSINEGKRSVSFYGYDGDKKIPLGNVTIPPNKDIPRPQSIMEVRYLYAYRGGRLYEPMYEKPRNASDISDCSITQLKYKTDKIAAW